MDVKRKLNWLKNKKNIYRPGKVIIAYLPDSRYNSAFF